MAGHFKYRFPHPHPQKFPDEPLFSHYLTPNRFEGEIQNLEVIGKVPQELDGTFYRVMPDPALPPFVANDVVSQSSFPKLKLNIMSFFCGSV
jgi:hypothetical protein